MKNKHLDFALLLIMFLGALSSGWYLFFFGDNVRRTEVQEAGLGLISPRGKDVRLRGDKDSTWLSLSKDSNVYKDDHIFTGNESTAEIEIGSSQKIRIDPNSLIIIKGEKQGVNLDISKGGFSGRLKKGMRFTVQNGKTKSTIEASAENTSVNLQSNSNGEIKLVVLRGEMKINSDSRATATTIKANSEATVSEAPSSDRHPANIKVTHYELKLLQPEPAAIVWSNGSDVNFIWQWATEDPTSDGEDSNAHSTNSILEVSQDPSFETDTQKVHVQSNRTKLHLSKEGVYFWRVKDLAKTDGGSAVSSFTLEPLLPPQIAPTTSYKVKLNQHDENSEPLKLEWLDPSLSAFYELELAIDPEFKNSVLKTKSETKSINLHKLKVGKYFVRIRSYHEGRESLQSNIGHIYVETLPQEPLTTEQKDTPKIEVLATNDISEKSPQEIIVPPTSELPVARAQKAEEPRAPAANEATALVVDIQPTPTPVSVTISAPVEAETPIKKDPIIGGEYKFASSWFWVGIGASLFYANENLYGYSKGGVTSLDLPQLMIRTGAFFTETSGFDLSYKETPAVITNPTSPTEPVRNLKWKIFSAEYLSQEKQKFLLFNHNDEFNWRFGIQSHQLISIIPVTPNSKQLDILPVSITNVSLGFGYNIKITEKSRYEIGLRYQHPLISTANSLGDQFSITPTFSFDGGIGYVFDLGEHLRFGSYWFGQWQSYKFLYTRGTDAYTGTQQFFNSTMDIRLGMEY